MRYASYLGLRAPDRPLFHHLSRSGSAIDQIEFVAGLGFSGIHDCFLRIRPEAEQARIGATLARHGMLMGSFTHDPAAWNRPTWNLHDAEARARLKTEIQASIATAQRSGGQCVTCVTARDQNRSHREQLTAMIDNLGYHSMEMQQAHVRFCIEVTAPAFLPGMLIETLEDALLVVNAVDSPAVGLTFDIGHLAMIGMDPHRAIDMAAGHIASVQVADVPGRIDLGAGTLDWPPIFRSLKAVGYAGLIEIEHVPLHDSADGERRLLERLRAIDAAI
jgi:sugar phosphate isomerase/epimerase